MANQLPGPDPDLLVPLVGRMPVEAAVARLRPRDREVLLRRWAGATYREIAAYLGVSRGRARQIYVVAERRVQSYVFPGDRWWDRWLEGEWAYVGYLERLRRDAEYRRRWRL